MIYTYSFVFYPESNTNKKEDLSLLKDPQSYLEL